MTLLTFSTLKDKLIRGEKKQTIRLNVSYWSDVIDKNNKLDIWWLNPRNQHPDCHKMGIAAGSYVIKRGNDLTDEDAIKDGFGGLGELIDKLMILHKFGRSDVLKSQWIIITWQWSEVF